MFGSVLPIARRYAELLVGPGVERGLLGPGEAPRVWERHLLNSAFVTELLPAEPTSSSRARVLADIGSGAGLPGIVLAMLLPTAWVILVEPMARRTTYLLECVEELGLANVDVRRARAEDLAGQVAADVVTARAVAKLDRLAALATDIARPGGLVLAIKGAGARHELAEAKPALRRLGASEAEIVTAGAGLVSQPTTVVRFTTRAAGDRPQTGRGGRS